jgi:hypothetical protein
MKEVQASDIGVRLIELLTQQSILYRQLRELSQKQTGLADGSDPETLLKILAARQRLIDKLKVITGELTPIRSDWQRVSAGLEPAQKREVGKLVSEVQNTLQDILARDEKDSQKLSDSKQQVFNEIQGVSAGKLLNRKYGQPSSSGQSRYLDVSSE